MAYIDLILNLAMLVTLSVLSGFVDRRWPRETFAGALLQGFLFGTVAIICMLRPLVMGPGLIFDGRSIVISLCALFFGHRAAAVTAAMAATYRLVLSGPGVVMGVSVILASAVIGLLARHYIKPFSRTTSTSQLLFLGIAVHAAMVALMFTLPGELAISTIKHLGLPVITLYPLATILAGKILSDQVSNLVSTKELQESEERYRLILERAPYAIFIQTEERFSYVNPAALRLFGAASPAEIIGRSVYERFHPDYIDIVRQRILQLNKERKAVPEVEQKYLKMDGTAIEVEVSAVPFAYQGKNGALVSVKDITDRKQAEEALRLKTLTFDTSIAAKSIADAEGIIIEANYSFLALWGYTNKEEVVGNPLSHFFKNTDEASALVTSLNRNGHWQGNFTAKKKDGSTFIGHSMATVIRDKNGNITGYQSSVSDITEHRQAEEALRQNRDLLARSEQIAHIGSWTLDLIANRLTWSDEVYRIFGFKPQEFNATYEAFLNAVHPDDRVAVDNAYSGSVREAQDGYEIEHRIVRQDSGEVRHVHERCVHERDDAGSILRSVGMVQDITARRKAEKALRESEEKYRIMVENANDIVYTLTLEGVFTYVSPTWTRLLGHEISKVQNHPFQDFMHPEDIPAALEFLARTITTGEKQSGIEYRVLHQDGTWRWHTTNASPIHDANGQVIAFAGIARDITERKQIEEQLRAAENTYRNIFLNAQIGMFRTDIKTGLILDANDAVAHFVGFRDREEMLAAPFSIAERYVNPGDREKMVALLKANGELNDFVTTFRRNDGSTIIMRFSGRLIPDKGWLEGVSADITKERHAQDEIRRLNVELEQRVARRTKELHNSQLALLNVVDDLNESAKRLSSANEALEALNRELEAFAYSVSHDLRAPLRSIDGFSAALLEDYKDKLDATGKNYLERVRNASQHMATLIDDILKLSRVSKADFRPEPVNLSEIAREIAANCKKDVGGKAVTVKITKDIVIEGDKALLQVALANLIDNAFKFSAKQKNALVEFGAAQEDGNTVYYVRDNGAGFDMTYASKLFGPFQRLHNVHEFEGTGVGLSTVQRIIHRHGGKIWAEAKVGKGATFFFTLPA